MPGSSPTIETGIDKLLSLLEKHERISIPQAAKLLKLPEDVVEAWAHTLEENGDVEIEYSLTTPFIIPKRAKSTPRQYTILVQRVREALRKKRYTEAWTALDTLLDILRGMIHDTPTIPEDIKHQLEELNLLLAEKKKPRRQDVEKALSTIEHALTILTQEKEEENSMPLQPPAEGTPTTTLPAGEAGDETPTPPGLLERVKNAVARHNLEEALTAYHDLLRQAILTGDETLLHQAEEAFTLLTSIPNPYAQAEAAIRKGRLDTALAILHESIPHIPPTPTGLNMLIRLLNRIYTQKRQEETSILNQFTAEEERFTTALHQGKGSEAKTILTRLISIAHTAPESLKPRLIERALKHAHTLAHHAEKAWEQRITQWKRLAHTHLTRLKHALAYHLPRSAEHELTSLLTLLTSPPRGAERDAADLIAHLQTLLPRYTQLIPETNSLNTITSLLTQAQHAPSLDTALSLYEEAVRQALTLPPLSPEENHTLHTALHDTLSRILHAHAEEQACAHILTQARRAISMLHPEEALRLLTTTHCTQPSLKPLLTTLTAEATLLAHVLTNKPLPPDTPRLLHIITTSPYTDPRIKHIITTHVKKHAQHAHQPSHAQSQPTTTPQNTPPQPFSTQPTTTHAPNHSTHPALTTPHNATPSQPHTQTQPKTLLPTPTSRTQPTQTHPIPAAPSHEAPPLPLPDHAASPPPSTQPAQSLASPPPLPSTFPPQHESPQDVQTNPRTPTSHEDLLKRINTLKKRLR